MNRLREEDGFAGGFEVLPFGFLVMIVGTLLLVNGWAVVDGNLAAGAAAREAVRAFVEDDGDTSQAARTGEQVAVEAIAGHGKDPARVRLQWTGDLRRCGRVTASVTYRVPIVAVPWVRAFGSGELQTTATHTEVVDPYRSGLALNGFVPEECRDRP